MKRGTGGRADGGTGDGRRGALILALALSPVLCPLSPAFAQCPDGSPPPCARAAARPAAPPSNSVAVLYFESQRADTSAAALADGLTEEVINRLSAIERLTVRSRYLVRRYRDVPLEDPAAVGRALNVTYLVSGSVRRVGGRLRVSAELVRAAGGVQVWGQQFDQAGDDVFRVQEEVARDVATGIVGRLLPAERQAIATRPTESAAAYQAFLRGNVLAARRDSTGLVRALREYQTALRADPGFTGALARIAWTYGLANGNGIDLGLPYDSVSALAMRAADDAVARAPNASDAWLALAVARTVAQPRTLAGAPEALERAIALDPANAEAHHLLAFTLTMLGQDSAGLEHDRIALAIEPSRAVTVNHFVQYYMRLGRFAEARRWLDSTMVVDRGFFPSHALLPLLLLVDGDTVGARAEVVRWREIPQLAGAADLALAILAVPGPDPAGTAARLAALRRRLPSTMPLTPGAYLAPLAMAATGDPDLTLDLLRAVRPAGAFLHYYMRNQVFDPIRQDPGFQRLFAETQP